MFCMSMQIWKNKVVGHDEELDKRLLCSSCHRGGQACGDNLDTILPWKASKNLSSMFGIALARLDIHKASHVLTMSNIC